jgi:hypothetical protein
MLGIADLEAWEEQHGQIPDGAVIIMRTGLKESALQH